MGTLFEQPLREARSPAVTSEDIMHHIQYLENDFGLEFNDAIQVIDQVRKANEADSRLLDRDIKDEQLMGFGELFQELIATLGGDEGAPSVAEVLRLVK